MCRSPRSREESSTSELVTSKDKVDLILIAPCTANTLSKIASGISDDPVSTLVCTSLGTEIPLVIAPAMHEPMLRNPILVESISKLKRLGVKFVEGRSEESKSKIATPEDILAAVAGSLDNEIVGSRELESLGFLITAGPTREAIDQVRFISNASSGKMGIALAQACAKGGAGNVCLILGPGVGLPAGFDARKIKTRSVVSTEDMLGAAMDELDSGEYDAFISAGSSG